MKNYDIFICHSIEESHESSPKALKSKFIIFQQFDFCKNQVCKSEDDGKIYKYFWHETIQKVQLITQLSIQKM